MAFEFLAHLWALRFYSSLVSTVLDMPQCLYVIVKTTLGQTLSFLHGKLVGLYQKRLENNQNINIKVNQFSLILFTPKKQTIGGRGFTVGLSPKDLCKT